MVTKSAVCNIYERILSKFPDHFSFVFAYGSGVFAQHDHAEIKDNMIDFIFAVDDPETWHRENIKKNKKHYSFLKYGGAHMITKIQQDYGAKMYFNTLIPIENRLIKYGVISTDNLIEDLLDWRTLYISGRMHKPVKVIREPLNEDIIQAINLNLQSALHASLLCLPESFSEEQLFMHIAGLSYAGDFRMYFGEDKHKVSNLVKPQLERFRVLYEAPLSKMPLLHWNKAQGTIEQDCSPTSLLHHLNLLPRTVQCKLLITWNKDGRHLDLEEVLQAIAYNSECGDIVLNALLDIVWWSSWSQSCKGIFTADLGMAELSSPHLKLASAADDIKIWEAPNFLLVHQFSPHPSPSFRSVHWGSDFQQLVIVPSSGHNVVLTLVKQKSLHNIEVPTEAATTTAKFSNTSPRFIGIGTEAGDILVWDIKYQKPKKSFMCQNGGITCLQFNWNDSYLASSNVNGGIVLHNLITGQSCSPLQVPNTQAIRGLQYSYMKRSLLGSASDDGAITLWDANTRQLYHNFPHSHTAPATGLSFSPVNNILLTSVGLDKRIICYDTQMKNLVKSLECENPLTSVDFMQDGLTLAVGSSRGNIFIYDLRSLNLPVQTLHAHNSSVQCLAFQNNILGSAVKKDSSRKTNSLRSESSGVADFSKTKKSVAEGLVSFNSSSVLIQKESTQPQQIPVLASTSYGSASETKRSSLTADIFSPIREDTLKHNQTPDKKIPVFQTKCSKTNISGEFSPLREESLCEQLVTRQQPIGGGENAAHSLKLGDRPITTGLAENERQEPSALSVMIHSSDCIDSTQRDGLIEGTLSPKRSVSVSKVFKQNRELLPLSATSELISQNLSSPSTRSNARNPVCSFSPLHTLTSPLPSLAVESFESARPDAMGAVDDANINKGSQANSKRNANLTELETSDLEKPQAMDIEVTDGPSLQTCKSNEVKSCSTDLVIEDERVGNIQTSMTPQAFQAEFVKQVVQDAMEEFRDTVHREFLNMHAQMIRHFQMQMAEMQALLQRYSINDELVSEIERLQEENRHLRATF